MCGDKDRIALRIKCNKYEERDITNGVVLATKFLEAVDRIDGNGEIMHVPSLTKYTVKNGKVADLNIDYISPNNDNWMIV